MPLEPDPTRAAELFARLDGLRRTVAAAEDDVLGSLVVTGEPQAQRVLDDWLDQVADTLRALGEAADRLAPVVVRHAAGSAGIPPRDAPGANAWTAPRPPSSAAAPTTSGVPTATNEDVRS